MRWSVPILALMLAVLFAHHSRAAVPKSIPLGEKEFTRFVADKAKSDFPDWSVTVVGSFTVKLKPPSGSDHQEMQMNLERIHGLCVREPENCEALIDKHLDGIAEAIELSAAAPTRSTLRAAVRSEDYVATLRDMTKGAEKDKRPLITPMKGGLWLVCYFDAPTTMKIATQDDLAKLGLNEVEAIALAKANVRADLKAPDPKVVESGTVGIIVEDVYTSSRLLFPEDWAALARKFDGQLLVAAPAWDLVIFIDGASAKDVEALRKAARDMMAVADRPLSETIFKWSPGGWQVVE
jgi:hypothetical protein